MDSRPAPRRVLVTALLLGATAPLWAQLGQGESGGPGASPGGLPGGPTAQGPRAAPAAWHLFYDLKLRLRAATIDTDLWAGGKLRMRGQRRGDGTLGLGLDRPLEDPWKLNWFTAGLLGAGLYGSSEIAPGQPAHAVRSRAEARANDFVRARHAAWKREWGGRAEFHKDHPPFCFTVLGDLGWRLKASARPTGALDDVQNLMTHAWVPDGIRRWERGSPEIGYGFWGPDATPPDWEPRTYKAFEAALALLGAPGFGEGGLTRTLALGQGGTYRVDHPGVPQKVVAVVETLVPRARGKIPGRADPAVEYRVVGVDAHRLTVEGSCRGVAVTDGKGLRLDLTRRLVYDRARAMMESDVLSLTLRGGTGKDLALTVGYQPGE